ncbi:MAG: class I SAM-dependent methyltransferase [Candidatus Freyarchaeum deiterrae]
MGEEHQWTKERAELYFKRRSKVTKRVYEPFAREIVEYVEKYKPNDKLTVLDLGSGPGLLSFEIKKIKNRYKIICMDPSDSMLEIAKNKAAEWGIKDFGVKIGSAEKIPLADENVDVIVSLDSVHEWGDLKKGIKEIHRVLKEEGIFIVRDSNSEYPKWKTNLFFVSFALRAGLKHARGHFQTRKWRSLSEMKQLLEKEHFSIEDVRGGIMYTIVGRKKQSNA